MNKVLIVDDNQQDLYLLQVLLEGHGYSVKTASNGKIALETAQKNPPDIVISDIMMPVMDGFTLCRKWMTNKKLKTIPFVFYTATYVDSKDRELAFSLGASRFVVKPSEPDKFVEIVKSILEDCQLGLIEPGATPQITEEETLKLYSQRLINKLETKSIQLKKEIEERKEASEQYRKVTLYTQKLLDVIPGGLIVINPDYSVALVNQSVRKILNGKDPIAEGLKCYEISHKSSKPCSGVFDPCPLKQVISSGEEMQVLHTHFDHEGKEMFVEISAAPVFNDKGEVVQVIESWHDVTERKRLEEQYRQAQKMEAIGQLTGGIAHDFNNMLQVINGYSDMALDSIIENPLVREYLTEVAKAGERATSLVSQLLAYSRRQVLTMKNIDLNDVISSVVKMVKRVLGGHILLNFQPDVAIGFVCADAGQVEQIIMNLCVNARDAMPNGGTISIKTSAAVFDGDFCKSNLWAKPGHYVSITVADEGSGMDENTLKHAFEPFFTTKDIGKGTGLGLSMVIGLVQQHGGLVKAYSEVNKGTKIEIYFPLAEKTSISNEQNQEISCSGGSETILIVEDDSNVLNITRIFLQMAGYNTLTAIDGVNALSVLHEHTGSIDLIFLDIMMPNLGGQAVFEQVRSKNPEQRFLFSSGYGLTAYNTDFILTKNLPLIQKPYQRLQLLKSIRTALDS